MTFLIVKSAEMSSRYNSLCQDDNRDNTSPGISVNQLSNKDNQYSQVCSDMLFLKTTSIWISVFVGLLALISFGKLILLYSNLTYDRPEAMQPGGLQPGGLQPGGLQPGGLQPPAPIHGLSTLPSQQHMTQVGIQYPSSTELQLQNQMNRSLQYSSGQRYYRPETNSLAYNPN